MRGEAGSFPEIEPHFWVNGFENDCGATIKQLPLRIHEISGVGKSSPNRAENLLLSSRLSQDDGVEAFKVRDRNEFEYMGDVVNSAWINAFGTRRLDEEKHVFTSNVTSNAGGVLDSLPVERSVRIGDFEAVVLSVSGFRSADVPIAASWIAHVHREYKRRARRKGFAESCCSARWRLGTTLRLHERTVPSGRGNLVQRFPGL